MTALNTALPLALAAAIVLPVLPRGWTLGWSGRVSSWMRQLSVLQTWNMYAPDPQRAHTYISVVAEFPGGRREPLAEAIQAEQGWSTIWDWEKRRVDIWRFYAVLKHDKPNPHRTWYLRGVCVREALARGEAPRRLIVERVRRRFTHPDEVRAGKPALGPLARDPLMTLDCQNWPVRDMIAAARARAAEP